MPDNLAIADVLDRAADMIEPEGAWSGCEGRYCAATAIDHAAGGPMGNRLGTEAREYFASELDLPSHNSGIWEWNDAPERTQEEVVAKLREAAAKARGGQS